MKFNFTILANTKFKTCLILLFLNTSIAHAEKFDLGPFKGKLSGKLAFTIDNSYTNYQYVTIDLSSGTINKVKDFKSSIGQSILAEPEISFDKSSVLFSGTLVNDPTLRSQIFSLDLKSKGLSIWFKSSYNFNLPRFSSDGEYLAFTSVTNSIESKNIIYNFKQDKFTELPCLSPSLCTTPNWDNKNKNIVYINNKSRQVKKINLKTKNITKLYETKNKFYVIYPSYTNNENVIFTRLFIPNSDVKSTNIMMVNSNNNKVEEIYTTNEYILSAITLNDDRYIAFITKQYKEQSKLTIYDRKTKQQIVYLKPLRQISVPIWYP